MASAFNSKMPDFPTDDPDYRIIRRVPSRYLHYYFYIRYPVIGPLAMCIGADLPFQTTYYLNGHNFIEIELRRQGVAFRKDDNAFLSTSDPKALPAAADKLSAATIEKRLNYWTWLLGPKFSEKDRKAVNLRRALPESIVVRTEHGELLTRSDAVIYTLRRLGGMWRVIAAGMSLAPRGVQQQQLRFHRTDSPSAIRPTQHRLPGLPADLRSRF